MWMYILEIIKILLFTFQQVASGFIEVQNEDETPIFRRQKINFRLVLWSLDLKLVLQISSATLKLQWITPDFI